MNTDTDTRQLLNEGAWNRLCLSLMDRELANEDLFHAIRDVVMTFDLELDWLTVMEGRLRKAQSILAMVVESRKAAEGG